MATKKYLKLIAEIENYTGRMIAKCTHQYVLDRVNSGELAKAVMGLQLRGFQQYCSKNRELISSMRATVKEKQYGYDLLNRFEFHTSRLLEVCVVGEIEII